MLSFSIFTLFRRNALFLLFLTAHLPLYSTFPLLRIVKVLGTTTAGLLLPYIKICELFMWQSNKLYIRETSKESTPPLFSVDDQAAIESIQTVDELREKTFPDFQTVPFYRYDPSRDYYNAQPFISENMPSDAVLLIKTYAQALEIKVDEILNSEELFNKKSSIEDQFGVHAGVSPNIPYIGKSFIAINIDQWNMVPLEEKIRVILHELGHLKLQHQNTIGIHPRTVELQADVYFALYGPYQETIHDQLLSCFEPHKDNSLPISHAHPSPKEIYTILNHAKKLRKQENKRK